MSPLRLTVLIDADLAATHAGDSGRVVPLIRGESEYVHAVARTAARASGRAVPDTAWLDLYAYELLERMRERLAAREREASGRVASEAETWVVPLWPAALFAAAGATAHAGREIGALYPAVARWVVRSREAATVEAAMSRLLGRVVGEPAAYEEALTRLVGGGGGEGDEGP